EPGEFGQGSHRIDHMLDHFGANNGLQGTVRQRYACDVANIIDWLQILNGCSLILAEILGLVPAMGKKRSILAGARPSIQHPTTLWKACRVSPDKVVPCGHFWSTKS